MYCYEIWQLGSYLIYIYTHVEAHFVLIGFIWGQVSSKLLLIHLANAPKYWMLDKLGGEINHKIYLVFFMTVTSIGVQ